MKIRYKPFLLVNIYFSAICSDDEDNNNYNDNNNKQTEIMHPPFPNKLKFSFCGT